MERSYKSYTTRPSLYSTGKPHPRHITTTQSYTDTLALAFQGRSLPRFRRLVDLSREPVEQRLHTRAKAGELFFHLLAHFILQNAHDACAE